MTMNTNNELILTNNKILLTQKLGKASFFCENIYVMIKRLMSYQRIVPYLEKVVLCILI